MSFSPSAFHPSLRAWTKGGNRRRNSSSRFPSAHPLLLFRSSFGFFLCRTLLLAFLAGFVASVCALAAKVEDVDDTFFSVLASVFLV